MCSARAWLSGSVPGQRRVLLRGYSLLQRFAFLTFRGTVAGSLGSCWVPLSGLDSRAQSGRPASIYAGGSLVLCLGSLCPA